MKKSILIIGPQFSGKTFKKNKILSEYEKNRTDDISFKEFVISNKTAIKNNFQVVAIDEIYKHEQLDYITKSIAECQLNNLIICTTIPFDQIPEQLKSFCSEVVVLSKLSWVS